MAKPVTTPAYPEVDASPSFPGIEARILAAWREEGVFEASVEERPRTLEGGPEGGNEYVFFDGPPFANGLPHFGHLLTGYVKDIVPRYQTMRGRRVERRFGWDCHGMPAELEAEKGLGISGRHQVLEYGIGPFNDYCRESVMRYTGEWREYVSRMARWVDFDNDYKTMDRPYMESVLWAFKELWDKGLIYEGFKVMPYSWAMETTVSNFETRMDNAYRERQDPAATVRFELAESAGLPGDESLPVDVLAWTTTPWTLPSNLALAVGPELSYRVVLLDGRRIVLGAGAAGKYERELGEAELLGEVTGADLVGRRFTPLFPYFAGHEGAFRILAGDFVTTEDGTGVVHLAPGFGEDDQRVCEEAGIALVCPVDEAGRFSFEVSDYEGLQVFEANRPILRRLKEAGKLLREESYVHNYPHCWRTDTPLIYKAVSSWFFEVTKIRERMVELNQEINWIPGHVRDGQFGRWLEGARDWAISRSRFWGAPLPVWRSDDPRFPRIDVYGSIAELEADFGVEVPDLHRPFIDTLTRPNPDDPSGQSTMRRIPDVFDCWFESGSMPYAQVHYPFENKDWFDAHFPADFVVEYVAQTRGWFYTMHVLATALFDKPPFKNVICHGVVVDEDNQKLSKRLRNYPDPVEMFDKHGSDAMRWYLCSSPILRGQDLSVDLEGRGIAEVVRLVIIPIWNAWAFFSMYARADGVEAEWQTKEGAESLLDRYVLAKTRELVEGVEGAMDAYDLAGACGEVRGFLDALNNWYIRRSRARFWRPLEGSAEAGWSDGDRDKFAAYDTLYTVLSVLTRAVAPLLPLVSEEIHRGLSGGDATSVHLQPWPDASALPADHELVAGMDLAREVCTAALSVRNERGLRVRLPLASLAVAGHGATALERFFPLIQDEVNVKAVGVDEDVNALGDFELFVNARAAGPRLGKATKDVIAASKRGEWSELDGVVTAGGMQLEAGEFELRLVPKSGLEELAIEALPKSGVVIALDVVTTPELEAEGQRRDVIRQVQEARKRAGLDVSDRVSLRIFVDDGEVRQAIAADPAQITTETLGLSLELEALDQAPGGVELIELGATRIGIEVTKQGA
ncbi:MAG: isoleucine--tRNA ligase [Planctomycetota bacterium]|nr:isoleucine--tRNA ligase [Planctomycetota bacterium]